MGYPSGPHGKFLTRPGACIMEPGAASQTVVAEVAVGEEEEDLVDLAEGVLGVVVQEDPGDN